MKLLSGALRSAARIGIGHWALEERRVATPTETFHLSPFTFHPRSEGGRHA
jgi:hypothetical protein